MNYYENELYHYGVKGMKWGRRRYQNPDGSLTSAGKKSVDSYNTRNTSTPSDSEKSALKTAYNKYREAGVRTTNAMQDVYKKYEPNLDKLYKKYDSIKNPNDADKYYETVIRKEESKMYKEAREKADKYAESERAAGREYNTIADNFVKKYHNVSINSLDRDELAIADRYLEQVLFDN